MTTRNSPKPVRPSPKDIRTRPAAQGPFDIRATERTVEIVNITPEMAIDWLKANTHNRNAASTKRLNEFKSDMLGGRWTFGLDAIGFDVNGVLLNGQTRLTCIAETGVTLPFIVARGLVPEDQNNMDLVRRRSMADQFSLAGKVNASTLAAIVTSHWRWINLGNPFSREQDPTFSERRVWESEHDFDEALRLSRRIFSSFRIAPTTLGPLIFEGLLADREGMLWFVERIIDGQAIEEGEAIYALRKAYQRNLAIRHKKAPQEFIAAWFIKAWNAFTLSRPVNQLVYRPGNGEVFPPMQGKDA